MTTVWLLTSGDYEAYCVEEVFTDHDLAQRWLVARQRQAPHDRTIGLEEWTARTAEPFDGTNLTLRLPIDRDGRTYSVTEYVSVSLEERPTQAWAHPREIGASGTDHDDVWACFVALLPDGARAEVQANLDAVAAVHDITKETP